MLEDYLLFFGSIALAMSMSCLCSLMEAAILSLTPSQVASLRRDYPSIGRICQYLKSNIERPISVILIINTAAHTIGASVAGATLDKLTGGRYLWLFSLIFTVLMVQYTEILPKTLGVRFNTKIMFYTSGPLHWATVILSPLITLAHFLNRPFEKRNPEKPNTTDEISALAAVARNSQVITSRQERIIRMVPKLSERTASDVMIPVENISFLYAEETAAEAISAAETDFHTRYPVCESRTNKKVIGYVNFKELVMTSRTRKGDFRLQELLRPVAFAAPEDTAEELLDGFASQHCLMIIVREKKSGETLGLLTLEDIIEELLGNLDDEFDPLPRTFYSPADNFWIVGGGVSMTQLARDTYLELPRRAEPCSAWFVHQFDRPVKAGDVVHCGDADFLARKIRRGQVVEFNVKRVRFDKMEVKL